MKWKPLNRRKNFYKNSSQKHFWDEISNLSIFGGEDENGFKSLFKVKRGIENKNVVFIKSL